ncbi:fused DNA-binding response regulator in two-component regulatory system with GlnL: response regulator; sigma54 interaction protein [Candidatus Accumulibacter aalborgensis]|uniref:DNA-binding transcriptional regulator NtrC n=2 Tax=Candidatus Accumulibacter aalborgensis TaxID=1860102 RepID=A0A1A8XYW2_9PROT|nr:fused DNA-binding response regulator in two-component regulatory system with GlnL: response regulator; sigma54 interaction protein [Candidatus Accumulibacter aalborgensis]
MMLPEESMKPVWIVDDDKSIRWVLEKTLSREKIPFQSFASATEALAQLDGGGEAPQILVSDIRMPGQSGLELLQVFKERFPTLPVIIMTAYSDLESAVSAFQGGAFEYLPKPFDVDQALELIRRAIGESLHQSGAPNEVGLTPEILGQAPAMQEVFRAIGRLSQSNATVLITGESGSGKELVARAVHRHSSRADKPFIAINTAAIPRDLLESELFGHERGAFTGAAAQRQGRFEQAEGGTLFLDEIGDMPAELQTRLLRVLSDGHYYRVGGHSPLKTKVRIIAATHQNLEERVRQGLFREDLFHRLNVIRVRLPSLGERREDIPILARHFLQKSANELGVEGKRFSDAALKHLGLVEFPGNVRQLENLCHWLTVMAPGQLVELADLPPELREAASLAQTDDWESAFAQEVDRLLVSDAGQVHAKLTHAFERVLINRALAHTGGRRIEAAQALGIGRNTITRKIQELGLDGTGSSVGEDREASSLR